MEAVSEREAKIVKGNKGNGGAGQNKPKRRMKTPFQLEILEKTYALDAYPNEAVRAELSAKLDLTDRQLQMWFCHRRLKDKKDLSAKKAQIPAVPPSLLDSSRDESMRIADHSSEHGSGSGSGSRSGFGSAAGSGSSPASQRESWKEMSRRMRLQAMMSDDDDMPPPVRVCRDLPPPLSVLERRAIALVEDQLGEPLREDGPILGMEFDPLPPDAFGAPIAILERQEQREGLYSRSSDRHETQSNKAIGRSLGKYESIKHKSSMRFDVDGGHSPDLALDNFIARASSLGHGSERPTRIYGVQSNASRIYVPSFEQDVQEDLPSSPGEYECVMLSREVGEEAAAAADSVDASNRKVALSDDILRMSKKRKIARVDMGLDAEEREKQIRRNIEQDPLRQKREEQMQKELRKHERERIKEEERLMREKQREVERLQLQHKREMARREKLLQKESMRAEKRRQKEELRREREVARRRAAAERATARRIARESMGLIEDERLELMELASSRKDLYSMKPPEQNDMQHLDSFRDFLGVFPPETVKLKRPFEIQPWINSEENVGNLLMAWRFLTSFADVLELWPFTLDEFVQAFHDLDSRLLCEVHIALLRLVLKDIVDVARGSTSGAPANSHGTANSDGGHWSIVEGAYAWGFDICSWQCHLNALTWPEILRQLALSAGFGPPLKKRSMELAHLRDNSEDIGCRDIVSTLRNGSAAESAAAMMKEKGLSCVRRSRHLLTPGTVKFAAFHVLSLEGSEGLTITELAEKIQKSGLRDLTVSKAPEASIAAALSRDSKLFQRTAPSTYSVRSPFRKDPTDAEFVLSAAREKLKIFESGFIAGEDADVSDRDEDDGDVVEASEVEDLNTTMNENEVAHHSSELDTESRNGEDSIHRSVSVGLQNEFEIAENYSSSLAMESSKDADVTNIDHNFRIGIVSCSSDPECIEIDESESFEPWVQGLSEGDYSVLSVEERLHSLVALVSIVNEGKSVRTVLENHLEAANALKKQMLADTQLEKHRVNEENLANLQLPSIKGRGVGAELMSSAMNSCENQSHLESCDLASYSATVKREPDQGSQRTGVGERVSIICPHQEDKYTVERSRAQFKSYIAHRAEAMYVCRSLPLGQDRRHNRYWQFVASASPNDPGAGRIFIELWNGSWRLIDSEEAFDALLLSLDVRGVREYFLHSELLKIRTSFQESARRNSQCTSILGQSVTIVENGVLEEGSNPNSTPATCSPLNMIWSSNSDTLETSAFNIELGRNEAEEEAALKRYQDFQCWTWQNCFSSLNLCAKKYGRKRCSELSGICVFCLDIFDLEDNYCLSCHSKFNMFDDKNVFKHDIKCEEKREVQAWNINSSLPLQTRLLKALLSLIEVSIPSEAFQSFWEGYRRTWGIKLRTSSSTEDLLQVLTLLEGAVKRDYLSPKFETTKELLDFCTSSRNLVHYAAFLGPLPVLPWIPLSTAAVALRLLELDASISYEQHQKAERDEDKNRLSMEFLSSDRIGKNLQMVELMDVGQPECVKEDENVLPSGNYKSLGCQEGVHKREHGKLRWQRRDDEIVHRGAACSRPNLPTQVSGWGRRVVRRRMENRATKGSRDSISDLIGSADGGALPRAPDFGKWGEKETGFTQMETDASNSLEEQFDEITQGMRTEHGNAGLEFEVATKGSTTKETFMELNEDYLDSLKDDYGGVEGMVVSSDESSVDSDGVRSGDDNDEE